MPLICHTIRGAEHWVEDELLTGAIVAFDVWRDGLGKFTGPLGRAAFLRGTSDVAHRIVSRVAPETRKADPWLAERLTRVLRHVLASRPRSAATGPKRSPILVP